MVFLDILDPFIYRVSNNKYQNSNSKYFTIFKCQNPKHLKSTKYYIV